ncbi:MAG TPA: hypothetical protein VFL12_02095, partial [Thermoanaerobaculia bacterium]|nr:hypothetical protein [Thermoanaerobaculia bacterium]
MKRQGRSTRRGASPPGIGARVGIVIDVPTPVSFVAVVRSHGWYDLPPFSREDATRTLALRVRRGRKTALLAFRAAPGGIEAEAPAEFAATELEAVAARVFSLSVDLRSFHAQAADDPDLSWAAARGAGRFLRAPSLWEDAVKMLLTTNCTWA